MVFFIVTRLILYFNFFIVGYVITVSSINIIQMLMAMISSLRYIKRAKISNTKHYSESYNMIPISILVPAFNEEKIIVQSIKSLLTLNYSNYEVIMINDGSGDNTLSEIIRAFDLKKITFPVKVKLKTKLIRGIYYNMEPIAKLSTNQRL